MNSLTKERLVLVVSGLVAVGVAILLASNGNPGNMAICMPALFAILQVPSNCKPMKQFSISDQRLWA